MPLSVLGLATVDLQSASEPSQVQVTSVPSPRAHVHFATTRLPEASADAEGTEAAGAGASLEATDNVASGDGAVAVELDPQPERRSAPAAAKETTNAGNILGARTARDLSSFHRRNRRSTQIIAAADCSNKSRAAPSEGQAEAQSTELRHHFRSAMPSRGSDRQ